MAKGNQRKKLSQEKRQILEHWSRFPVLAELYKTPEQYALALRKIEAKVRKETEGNGVRKTNKGDQRECFIGDI